MEMIQRVFASIGEYADEITRLERDNIRPGAGRYTHRASSQDNKQKPRDSWDLDLGFQASLKLAMDGGYWADAIDSIMPAELDVPALRTAWGLDVPNLTQAPMGFAPIVPAVLANSPHAMLHMDTHREQNHVLSIGLSCVHPCTINAETLLARGAAVLSVVTALELMGIRCEIWSVYRNQEDVLASVDVCVKRAEQHWDPASVAFALCHPAFARRLGFRYLEGFEEFKGHTDGGYGWYGSAIHWDDFDLAFPHVSHNEADRQYWLDKTINMVKEHLEKLSSQAA